ncbi:hypothetical protein RJ641_011939 [Dillenia turbinata]|uniref:Uncharacterized protein n=1 Tax=Dillenia turbinata TaxID=194707 RepID=A0AAN8V5N2_9MAGN
MTITNTIFAPVSLHSQVSFIKKFNGLNLPEWSEQVQFHLGVLDLELVLLHDKPANITNTSSTKQKSFNKALARSNRLRLMFMQMTIAENIKSTFLKLTMLRNL